ncbi:DUF5615 family PIN-like protein [Neomoorella thermoacetica]|uniref:DUF5615 family PIN-like protein n=1 Tax=Neomoorella thermoacetica TaxID=1525 RepID=UPI003B970C00
MELLGIYRNEKRVLVTLDMDFSDIRRYRPEDYQGIILLRIASQGKQSVINLFKKVIPHLRYQKLIGYLWIVQKDRIYYLDCLTGDLGIGGKDEQVFYLGLGDEKPVKRRAFILQTP